MHDLNSQEQPRHRGIRASLETAPRAGRLRTKWRFLWPPPAIEVEESIELSALDERELASEESREMLRDRRQARAVRKANAEMDLRFRHFSLLVLALGALGATAVLAFGLWHEREGFVGTGLVAFAAISGTTLSQRLLSLWERRQSEDERDFRKHRAPPD